MSGDLWLWSESCEGKLCCGNCDDCPYAEESIKETENDQ